MKGKAKDEIVLLLLEEDRTQPKIGWGNQREEGDTIVSNSRGGGGGEEGRGGEPNQIQVMAEEDNWEDIQEEDEEDKPSGKETASETSPKAQGKVKLVSPRHQGRQGGRGYWVKKREAQIMGRTKSKCGGDTSPQDSKYSKQRRVKGSNFGAGQTTGDREEARPRLLELPPEEMEPADY